MTTPPVETNKVIGQLTDCYWAYMYITDFKGGNTMKAQLERKLSDTISSIGLTIPVTGSVSAQSRVSVGFLSMNYVLRG